MVLPFSSYSKEKASRQPASISSGSSDKAIEVKGQTRNLNMLLKLQGDKEQIDFIKLRKDYEEEIESLAY